jgi:tRNA G18 (ribose-2'-O)-methylase SpoU
MNKRGVKFTHRDKFEGLSPLPGTAHIHQMNDSEAWDASRMEEPSLLKYNVHTPLQGLSVETVKKLSSATALPLVLMMYNLNGDMNVGMSIRSAVIYGCSDVYIVGKKRYDRRPEVGARNYIQFHRVPSITPSFFVENKLVPIFVEQGGTLLEDFSFKPYLPNKLVEGWKVCLVMGSESYGIPMTKFKELNAPIISISQYGVMRSLNVSIATGIVLYEFTRQWRESVKNRTL